jgi:glucosamine--fructose-6-phosphate aminotransferase (isomerizing)
MLTQCAHLFVVGRGLGLAVAQEAALKLKETCGLHAEAVSAAEIIHGPWTLAGEQFPVLLLSQNDETLEGMSDLVVRLSEHGVPVIVAGPASGSAARKGITTLPIEEDLHPLVAPIALIQSFYPLVEAVARARGRDPDNPPRLRKVTETL